MPSLVMFGRGLCNYVTAVKGRDIMTVDVLEELVKIYGVGSMSEYEKSMVSDELVAHLLGGDSKRWEDWRSVEFVNAPSDASGVPSEYRNGGDTALMIRELLTRMEFKENRISDATSSMNNDNVYICNPIPPSQIPKVEWHTDWREKSWNEYHLNLEKIEQERKQRILDNYLRTIKYCDYFVNFNILSEEEMRQLGISYVNARKFYVQRKSGVFLKQVYDLYEVQSGNNFKHLQFLPLQDEMINVGISEEVARNIYRLNHEKFVRGRDELNECFDETKVWGVYFCEPLECDWRINVFENDGGRLLSVVDDCVVDVDGCSVSCRRLEL